MNSDTINKAISELKIKCLDNIENKSFLMQRSSAVVLIRYIEFLEGEINERKTKMG